MQGLQFNLLTMLQAGPKEIYAAEQEQQRWVKWAFKYYILYMRVGLKNSCINIFVTWNG